MLEGHAIKTTPPHPGAWKGCASCNPVVETAGFAYAQTNKANNVHFAPQSFCNPPIASLIKAINAGFLKGSHTLMCMQYGSISLPVLPPQRDI
jgi:hypothetical protein